MLYMAPPGGAGTVANPDICGPRTYSFRLLPLLCKFHCAPSLGMGGSAGRDAGPDPPHLCSPEPRAFLQVGPGPGHLHRMWCLINTPVPASHPYPAESEPPGLWLDGLHFQPFTAKLENTVQASKRETMNVNISAKWCGTGRGGGGGGDGGEREGR